MDRLYALVYLALLGAAAHVVGNALPREWFHADHFPYKSYSWEREGRLYRKLLVHRWKDKVPDMSKLCDDMLEKAMRPHMGSRDVAALVDETCVAECVHWALILLSAGILFLSPTPFGALLTAADVLLLNLPFIIIQRYNRPKLVRLCGALRQKESRGGAGRENSDSFQQ